MAVRVCWVLVALGWGGVTSVLPLRAPFLVISMSFCFTGQFYSPQGSWCP